MSVIWADTPENRRLWDDLVQSHPAGTPYLLSWYLDQQQLPRTHIEIAYVEQNRQAAAGAVLYTFELPGKQKICLVPSGPLVREGHAKHAMELLKELGSRAKSSGASILQYEAFEAEMRDLIRESMTGQRFVDEAVWKLYHPTLWRELRVDLRGKTADTLLASFTTSSRRRIKQADEMKVTVQEVRDNAGIDEVYNLWIEGGERKDYTIRPLESFRRLVHATYEREAGVLLLSRVDGQLAAFIHSLFYRCGAMYMSGAHKPNISQGFGNRVLQYRAMCMAIERKIPYYSLGGPSTGGVREFKEGFRPALVDNMRFVTFLLKPVMARMLRGVVGQSQWIQKAKRWASRSMSRK